MFLPRRCPEGAGLSRRLRRACRPASARPSVTSSAYSRSPPTGSPLASRVTRHVLAQPVGEVGGGRLAGHRRVRGEHDLLDAAVADALEELLRSAGRAARRRRAARARRRGRGRGRGTRACARARGRRPAARRRRSPSGRVGCRGRRRRARPRSGCRTRGRPDARLDVGDRVPEGVRLVRGDREEVEREPLRGPGADPGQPRELRDEVVDRGAQHAVTLTVRCGRGALVA